MWREHTVNKWADATGGEGLERSFWNEVKNNNWNEHAFAGWLSGNSKNLDG